MFSDVIRWRNKPGSKKTPEFVKAGRGQLVEATCGGAAACTYSHLEGRTTLSRGAASRAEAARHGREREGTEQSRAASQTDKRQEAAWPENTQPWSKPQKKSGATFVERSLLRLQPDLHHVQRRDCKHTPHMHSSIQFNTSGARQRRCLQVSWDI